VLEPAAPYERGGGVEDPRVLRIGTIYYMTYTGYNRHDAQLCLATSPDLRHWTYLHPLVEGTTSKAQTVNPVDAGDMWECPDFFPLGNRHVLLISTKGKVHWKVGTYVKQRFTPEKEGVVDWGSYYAAKTMLDADGNRILWGWITETRPDAELIAAGWAGVMSLPRTLSLNAQNELQTEVAPLARKLRTAHTGINPDHTPAARQKILDTLRIHEQAAELELRVQPKGSDFTLHMQSENGADFATIACVNQSPSRQLRVNTLTAPLTGEAGSRVHVHLFLDGSVLEIFANGTTAVTARIYQIPSSPLRVRLEGNAELTTFDAWQMTPISKDRLTGSLCS